MQLMLLEHPWQLSNQCMIFEIPTGLYCPTGLPHVWKLFTEPLACYRNSAWLHLLLSLLQRDCSHMVHVSFLTIYLFIALTRGYQDQARSHVYCLMKCCLVSL